MWVPEKYSGKGQEVMQASLGLAHIEKVNWDVRHVAIALFERSSERIVNVLQSVVEIDYQKVSRCWSQIREQTHLTPRIYLEGTFSDGKIIAFQQKAESEAYRLNSSVIKSEHLLLVLTDPQYTPSDIVSILASFGITKEAVEKALADIPKP